MQRPDSLRCSSRTSRFLIPVLVTGIQPDRVSGWKGFPPADAAAAGSLLTNTEMQDERDCSLRKVPTAAARLTRREMNLDGP
ncbi:hypothetical protein F2981_12495 [Sinorhizobium meliloti]|nr:hypothetical protein [Sinorhizobium meliloti]